MSISIPFDRERNDVLGDERLIHGFTVPAAPSADDSEKRLDEQASRPVNRQGKWQHANARETHRLLFRLRPNVNTRRSHHFA